jgi:hypothetical protein
MISNLKEFIPINSLGYVSSLIENEKIEIKIVNERSTKHGDFKRTRNGDYIITINKFSNQFRFLLTLIHELAHYFVTLEFKNSKPHGNLWKNRFRNLLNPILNELVFPRDLLKHLINHMKNPKSSFSYDIELSKVIDKYDLKEKEYSYLDEIDIGQIFVYGDGNKFIKNKKRRKRYLCTNLLTKRQYLFLGNAKVKIYENSSN